MCSSLTKVRLERGTTRVNNQYIIMFKKYFFIFLGLVLIAVLGMFCVRYKHTDYDGYYAVYLNNGQIYFGNIDSGHNVLKLTNVHTLETYKSPTVVSSSEHFYLQQDGSEVSYKVNKRTASGGDVIGGDGVLYINRENILYWEKLSGDSKVLKLINEEK